MRPADSAAYRDRSRKLEIRVREHPAGRSANSKRSDASQVPGKVFVPAEPNTSEWDFPRQVFPWESVYRCWRTGGRGDSDYRRFPACPGCGSRENELLFAERKDARRTLPPRH